VVSEPPLSIFFEQVYLGVLGMRLHTVLLKENSADGSVVFEGKIVIELLPGRERLKVLKEINLTPDSNGSISFNSDTIEAVIRGTSIVEKMVKEVDLVVGGEKVSSFEDLEYCSSFNAIIMKLISVIINGPERLGNV
jgi:hypothetical protein